MFAVEALAFATIVLLPVPARVCAQSAVPPHIAAAHVFLTAWGHERWEKAARHRG